MLQGSIIEADLELVRSLVSGYDKAIWLGALSFEERCTGSFASLCRASVHFTEAIFLSYPTDVLPPREDAEARDTHWRALREFESFVTSNTIERVQLEAYSFAAMDQLLEQRILSKRVKTVVFDITCMTKVHALALAARLSTIDSTIKWVVSYSLPENYGTLESRRRWSAWRDVIVAPLAETATLSNEAHSRGIIIPGHEADRLIVALAELEPSGGAIILGETPERPDLRRVSMQHNRKIIQQLRSMRSSNWTEQTVPLVDYYALEKFVGREIATAQRYSAPVVLFPYGAKSLIFAAAFTLSLRYPARSWFVYPIPSSYDVNYSEGIARTIWLTRATA